MANHENQPDGQLTPTQMIKNLKGSDLGLRVYAAWWLGRFRVKTSDSINALIGALEDEDDRTDAGGYPLRRNAARALGKLGDKKAVAPLMEALTCTDFHVREAAVQSLGMLGDQSCITSLLQLLQDKISGTNPAPEPPNLNQPYDSILETLGELGASSELPLISSFLNHELLRIQFSAARAMYQLTSSEIDAKQYADRLIEGLSHQDLQLRRSVLLDLGAIGYFPAAKAIFDTHAENSLKLISMKGLLKHEIQNKNNPTLSENSIILMELIDNLM